MGGSLRGSQISGQDRHQIGQKFSSRVAQKTTEIPLLPLEILKNFFALRAKKIIKITYSPLEMSAKCKVNLQRSLREAQDTFYDISRVKHNFRTFPREARRKFWVF